MAFGRILKYAKLSPTEEKDFRILFIQSMLAGFGAAFFFVVANAYFIQKTKVSNLPPGYIMSGIFGYLLITVYKKLQNKFGVVVAYSAGFIVYGLSGASLFWGRWFFAPNEAAQTLIAYIGFIVVLPFAAIQVLGFSTVSLRVFNISQSKRLLALIGTGEVIASIIAYLLIPFLTKWLGGNAPLLLFSAIANILATIPLRKLYTINRDRFDSVRSQKAVVKMNLSFFRKDRFFMLIAVVTFFSVAAVYFADYAYLLSVRYIHSESVFEIADIMAVIFCVIKIGELLFSLFSARFIRTYGMQLSLVILPAMLVVSSLVGGVAGVIFVDIPFFVVCFLLFNKWAERVVRKGLTIPSMKVLYQVTEPHERAQLQAAIDGTVNQYATICAGVLLLALSYLFNSERILFFLKSISFVYAVIFAAWTWAAFALFARYRVKIREYLNGLKKHKPAHFTTPAHHKEVRETGREEVYRNVIEQAEKTAGALTGNEVHGYLLFYNPGLKSAFSDRASSLPHIKRVYYNNENFFSRLLIIWYMDQQDDAGKLKFVKEYYAISELELRIRMLAMLNRDNLKVPPEDVFFFTGLCQDNATEIMWAYACINDLEANVQPQLLESLQDHIIDLQNLMFQLLKVLYEKKYIVSVEEIFNSEDKSEENILFAIELLDSLLELQMKKMIVPLFEDIPYNARKEKLQKILLVYQLPYQKRLKEVLMTSYVTVSPYIKQLALGEYYRLTGDTAVLSAFAASSVESLSATARSLINEGEDPVYAAKMKVIGKLNLPAEFDPYILVSFTKWGLFSSAKKRAALQVVEQVHRQTFQFNDRYVVRVTEDGANLSLDILGLALLFKLKKRAVS